MSPRAGGAAFVVPILTANGSLVYSETLATPDNPRDALGRIVTRTEMTPSGIDTWKYTYDARGRLTVTTRNDELYERLTYDANDNRIRRETLDGDIAATYDAQDRMLTYGSFAYTYTANGELRTKTDTATGDVTTYSYDVRGNLVRVVLPDGTPIDYVMDGLDRRVAKKKNGAVQKRWLYRDGIRIAAELDGNGTALGIFVYGSRPNAPDYVVRQDGVYRFVSDHIGSRRTLVSAASGLAMQATKSDPWGVGNEEASMPITSLGFAGGIYDEDTKLVRFGARDYDAETGRWTTRDPILFGGGDSNLYAYVGNNAVNATDGSGLAAVCNYTGDPLLIEGSAGAGHGHSGDDDTYVWAILPSGQCVDADHPLTTPDGTLSDVDAVDYNGDGILKHPMSWRDTFGNEKLPGGDNDWHVGFYKNPLPFGPRYIPGPAWLHKLCSE